MANNYDETGLFPLSEADRKAKASASNGWWTRIERYVEQPGPDVPLDMIETLTFKEWNPDPRHDPSRPLCVDDEGVAPQEHDWETWATWNCVTGHIDVHARCLFCEIQYDDRLTPSSVLLSRVATVIEGDPDYWL